MIVIKKEIYRQTIEDIFVTALEGGSNYWYFLSDKSIKAIRDAVPKEVEPYLSLAISKAIIDHGVDVAINDADSEDEIGIISMKTMADRLQKLSNDKEYKWAFDLEIEERGDAQTSDIWFQYMAMGEVNFG